MVKLVEKLVGWRSQQKSQKNIAVGVCQTFLTAAGRPGRSTVNGHIFDRWGKSVGRPGRPKQTESTEQSPVDPSGRPTCTYAHLCTSVDPSDRPASVRSEKSDPAETKERKLVLILGFKDLYKRGTRLIKLKSMIIDQYSTCYIILIEKTFLNKNLFFQTWYFQNMLTLGNILK